MTPFESLRQNLAEIEEKLGTVFENKDLAHARLCPPLLCK